MQDFQKRICNFTTAFRLFQNSLQLFISSTTAKLKKQYFTSNTIIARLEQISKWHFFTLLLEDWQILKRRFNFTTSVKLWQIYEQLFISSTTAWFWQISSDILFAPLLLNDFLLVLLLHDWQIFKRRFHFTTSIKLWQIYEQLFISSTTAWFWQISSDILFAPLLLNVDRFLNDFLLVLLLQDCDRFFNNLLLVRLLLQECNN